MLVIIDDHTRFKFVYFMQTKSEAKTHFSKKTHRHAYGKKGQMSESRSIARFSHSHHENAAGTREIGQRQAALAAKRTQLPKGKGPEIQAPGTRHIPGIGYGSESVEPHWLVQVSFSN